MFMKINWKKLIEIVLYAIISALSAIGTGEAQAMINSL